MSKRVLIGLLAVSLLVIWGNAANAFNRINGVVIKHRSIEVEVSLCGDPLEDTLLTLLLELEVEIQCANPSGKVVPGNPGHQTFPLTFDVFQAVPSNDFTTAVTCNSRNNNNATTLRTFTFDLASEDELKCKQKKFTKVPGSELVKSAEVTAKWCTDDNDNNSCQDEERIEFVETACTGSRDGEGPPPEDATSCEEVEHVDDLEGIDPPPLTAVAEYDFEDDDIGLEKGYSTIMFTAEGELDDLELTATAGDHFVYMDGLIGGRGGMGVCKDLDEGEECDPSSDDSVSDGEILKWEFNRRITHVVLSLADGDHNPYGTRSIQFDYGGNDNWVTATAENSVVTLQQLDGSESLILFKTVNAAAANQFYIRNAEITYEFE